MMEYKGYLAKVEFDSEANLFHGQVVNIRDVITFQGQSVEELRHAFADSVEDYLEFCAERNREPEKPFSGRFLVRIDPLLHRDIAVAASWANQSINAWVTAIFRQALASRPAALQVAFHRDISQVYNKGWEVVLPQLLTAGHILPKISIPPSATEGVTISKQVLLPDRTVFAGNLAQLTEEDLINAA